MPTFRVNRGVDPQQISSAIGSLADAFKPPTAQELYAGAKAEQTRQQIQNVADAFAYAKDPNFDQARLDRIASVAGAYTPAQSLTAVGMNNDTTLRANAADNTRALAQTRLQQEGENARNANTVMGSAIASLFPALNPGQVRPAVPDNIMRAIGLDPIGPALGLPKPQTKAEAEGEAFNRLPSQDQRNALLAPVGVTAVQGPNGPQYVATPDAAGLAPQPDNMSEHVVNYGTADGRKGLARPDRAGRMFDAQTGQPLPADAQIFSAQATGTPDQLGGKTTEGQDKNAYAAKMTEAATRDLLDAFDTGKLPTAPDGFIRGLAAMAPGGFEPTILAQMSPEGQRFFQNVRTALPMQLLTQSGQGVTEREYERKMLELVPVAGEDPGVTAAKRRQFATYSEAVRGLAGGAAAKVGLAPAGTSGAPIGSAGTRAAPASGGLTASHIAALRANPDKAAEFDAKFGTGLAATILGGR